MLIQQALAVLDRRGEVISLKGRHCSGDLAPNLVLVTGRVHEGRSLAEYLDDGVEPLSCVGVGWVMVDASDRRGQTQRGPIADLRQVAASGFDEWRQGRSHGRS